MRFKVVISLNLILALMGALALSGISAGVGLIGDAIGAYNSYQDQQRAERQLNTLNATPYSRYTASPYLKRGYSSATAGASNPIGYSGAQTNKFRSNLSQMLNSRFNAANNYSGGQSSRAINAVLRGQETDSLNTFAANDSNMARENQRYNLGRMDRFANEFQDLDNKNTSVDISRRQMQEQALGNSIRSQKDYRRKMLTDLGGQALGTAGYLLGRGGSFGKAGESLVPPTDEDAGYLGATPTGMQVRQKRYDRFKSLGAYE